MKQEVIDKPIYICPLTAEQFPVPEEIQLDGSYKKLTFFKRKSGGMAIGGWYQDDDGQEFLVKTSSNSYLEKLLNNLAKIAVGREFVGENNLTGSGEFDGKLSPCFVSSKISGYYDLKSIEDEDERKSHATKFHPAYVFYSLIANDDSNEGNIGLDKAGQAKIIDFGHVPQFLNSVQVKHSHIPFHLASLIGHRNARGMQATRNRYFGYDGFLNPLERKKWATILAPEETSYYNILVGVKKIVDQKEEIAATISQSIKELEAQNIDETRKAKYLQQLRGFQSSALGRIDFLGQAFATDLTKLEENKEQFSQLKWRMHPEFSRLMKIEKEIFDECVKKSCEDDFKNISQIIGVEASREEILKHNYFEASQKEALRKYNDKNNALHNAVMNNDLPMVKWLINNDLADINKSRRDRSHNYQNFRLTPLHTAIAIYYDRLTYDTANSASSHEMIDVLKEKFLEKNGAKFEEEKPYLGDKLAIMTTFLGLEVYQERSSNVNNEAAAKIQKAFRNYQKVKEIEDGKDKPKSVVAATTAKGCGDDVGGEKLL